MQVILFRFFPITKKRAFHNVKRHPNEFATSKLLLVFVDLFAVELTKADCFVVNHFLISIKTSLDNKSFVIERKS